MEGQDVDPSVEFGKTEGLYVYNIARSIDSKSSRSDTPILALAEDAVRTAIRHRLDADLSIDGIEIELAVIGLIAALEGNIESQL